MGTIRREFFDYMGELLTDKRIHLLMMDLGYPRYDELKGKYPNQVFNTGASEQTALDMAVGIAQSGGIPFTYTITPFYWRGAETIRTYISHERTPVRMCGAGRNMDYTIDDGFSHDGKDIGKLMGILDIACRYPNTVEEMRQNVREMIKLDEPSYLSLRR